MKTHPVERGRPRRTLALATVAGAALGTAALLPPTAGTAAAWRSDATADLPTLVLVPSPMEPPALVGAPAPEDGPAPVDAPPPVDAPAPVDGSAPTDLDAPDLDAPTPAEPADVGSPERQSPGVAP